MFEQFHGGRRMICGVCAWIGMRSGLPIWAVRIMAVLLLLTHGPLAVVAYLGTAIWLKTRAVPNGLGGGLGGMAGRWQSPRWPGPAPSPRSPHGSPAAAQAWEHDALVDRFSRLDRRLSTIEAEATGNEFELRRGFRDLEKS